MPALQPIIDNRPDVVLLDLGLPDVDGLQVLSMVRSVSAVR
jgi:DNA-binding response OmpR family regulator